MSQQDPNNKAIQEMRRHLPLLEHLEANPRLWDEASQGRGIATLNGYRNALAKAEALQTNPDKSPDPWERTHYSATDFNEATSEIKALLETLPNIKRHPKTGEVWEIVTTVGIEGSEPKATAFVTGKSGHIAIHIDLRDCGDKPFAVVDITRHHQEENWHAAHIALKIGGIYPHQIQQIPTLIAWLDNQPCPTTPPILPETSDTTKTLERLEAALESQKALATQMRDLPNPFVATTMEYCLRCLEMAIQDQKDKKPTTVAH